MNKRTCPQCNVEKEVCFENFYRSKQTKDGYRSWCKDCFKAAGRKYDQENPEQLYRRVIKSRNRSEESKKAHSDRSVKWARENPLKTRDTCVARTFNVPKGWLTERNQQVNGCCEICGVAQHSEEHPKWLCVDHNHTTGEPRGLLCSNCNLGIGQFKERTDLMLEAIKYLNERGIK
jgi:hypothetical protein